MIVKWDVHSIQRELAVAFVEIPDDFMHGLRALLNTLQCGDRVRRVRRLHERCLHGTLMSSFHFGSEQSAVVVWDDGSAGLWRVEDLRRE